MRYKKQDNLQLNMCADDDMFVDSMYCNKYPLSNHSFKYNLCSYLFCRPLVFGSWPNCQGK